MATQHETPGGSQSQEAIKALWQDPDVAKKYANGELATRPYGKIIVEKSGLAQTNSDAYIFDLATGTGAAVKELYDAVPKEKWGQLTVLGGDVSPGMLEYLKHRGKQEGWTGLETQVVDGNVSLAGYGLLLQTWQLTYCVKEHQLACKHVYAHIRLVCHFRHAQRAAQALRTFEARWIHWCDNVGEPSLAAAACPVA